MVSAGENSLWDLCVLCRSLLRTGKLLDLNGVDANQNARRRTLPTGGKALTDQLVLLFLLQGKK